MSDYEDINKGSEEGSGDSAGSAGAFKPHVHVKRGIKDIQPIKGSFKPKKCVKTVSYRGRPRYICPASGGETAVHSLENLPVKPEDTPRKLAEIAQTAPEHLITPKRQREEPQEVQAALRNRPTSIHLQDVEEAGPDTEHDHLHYHSPNEATEKESDAIILKDSI